MYDAICNGCETKFEVSEGSGMFAMPFHCNVCGKVWDWVFGRDEGTFIEDEDGPTNNGPPSKDAACGGENRDDVWSMLGEKPNPPPCECGGTFDVSAPPRCPNCRSTDFRRDPLGRTILYD
jgi:hypothetical protein